MKLASKLAVFCVAAVLVACGTKKEETATPTPAPTKTVEGDKASAPATLPRMIIAKVPVGADGKELNDQAEIRQLSSASQLSDAEMAAAAFSKAEGQSITIADELDQDSSTQQWHGRGYGYGYNSPYYYWNTPWYPGKLLGRGATWGRNPYVYYGGYSYPYYYGNSYYYNSCNYYYYYW